MATAKTNRAVDAYRKLILKQRAMEDAQEVLHRLVASLDSAEVSDYARMTFDIDRAADVANDGNTAAFRSLVNAAGLDR